EYSYAPFGETTRTGAVSTNPLQFTGRENDGTTGLCYYRARYYHPVLQRFISEDPIGFAGGDANLYAYVGNSPVSYIDPFGQCRDPGGPGIRYCIETFIPQATAWGFDGDNRGSDPNSGSFRTRQSIYQQLNGLTVSSLEPGTSRFGTLARQAALGPFSFEVKPLPLGGRKIIVSAAASDGLFFGLAPEASYRLTILESADGISRVINGETTAFPSLEIYQYSGPGSQPRLVYHYDAKKTGTGPLDLFRKVPLP
ncbi:MAG: RHS repeat-associated core domain-containing protein, partial [Candidatus Binatia bacterium]